MAAMHTVATGPAAPSGGAAPATRWHSWWHTYRPALYLDATTGQGILQMTATGDGEPFTCQPRVPLSVLVEVLPVDVRNVYLCGTLPVAPQVTADDGEMYSPFNSWVIEARPDEMRLSSGTDHDETFARFTRLDGHEVMLCPVAHWLSTNDCTPVAAYRALALATQQLRGQYGWQDVCLLSTPAATGRELWRTSIGAERARGYKQSIAYPLLSEDARTLLRSTSGQGRFEMLPAPPSGTAPALVYLDGRFAYAAPALNDLGIGPVTHDTLPIYAGFTPARYRVEFRVPNNWAHVGLFMVPQPDDPAHPRASRTREGRRQWYFPREPGTTGETWADAAEMRIALAPFPHSCATCAEHYRANDGAPCPEHGWALSIKERIVFMPGKPLHAWAQRLVTAREHCAGNALAPLARAAVRNILLHGIGAFHGTRRPITRSTGRAGTGRIPPGAPISLAKAPNGDEIYLWDEPGMTPRFPDYERPEWSAQVWAKTRARLLLHQDYDTKQFVGALTLPFEQIVAFRLDALYLTADPGWPDSGRPGAFRVKGQLDGPVPWPQEEVDLAAVKERLENK